jgi:hypothetical protein
MPISMQEIQLHTGAAHVELQRLNMCVPAKLLYDSLSVGKHASICWSLKSSEWSLCGHLNVHAKEGGGKKNSYLQSKYEKVKV